MRALALVLLLTLGAAPAAADQTDERLPSLFARLKAADEAAAKTAEATIWQVWMVTRTEEAIIPFRRALAAMESGRLEDALVQLDDVVEKAPDFAEGWNKRATVFFMLGRMTESAADVARTLDLEPRHFGALAGLGLIRRTQGREAEALAAFEQGLAVNPHMPNIEAQARDLRRRVRGRAI
jgi:tetratricopeptide (TPR) repeat protein